ncbi:uncharacterized protein [Cherax quadricarinatus]|uniref:uncharacterized protein isoform X2 n=1 Tax=Cherax quadricarinatus TaxID=27406 RepID=UPI00387E779D
MEDGYKVAVCCNTVDTVVAGGSLQDVPLRLYLALLFHSSTRLLLLFLPPPPPRLWWGVYVDLQRVDLPRVDLPRVVLQRVDLQSRLMPAEKNNENQSTCDENA